MNLIFPYFNNGMMLNVHLNEWKNYSNREHWNVVIVDDCSKRDPITNHLNLDVISSLGFGSFRVFRILDDIPWNQNGARNLAMKHVEENEWCLSTDIDHVLTSDVADRLLKMKFENKSFYYRPHRILFNSKTSYKKHPNTYIIHPSLYWKTGGMDESYCGWYGSDGVFRRRLEQFGIEKEIDESIYVTLYGRDDIPDASTTDYGRKGSEYHSRENIELRNRSKQNIDPIPPINFTWERIF